MYEMGEFLGLPKNIIDDVFIEIDTNNTGEITLNDWVTYILECRANGLSSGNALIKQLENEQNQKKAASSIRFNDNNVNILDPSVKLNDAELDHIKELASNLVDEFKQSGNKNNGLIEKELMYDVIEN